MSERLPHAVLSEHLQEQLQGLSLKAAVFMTYCFEPGFFESEILPVLFDMPLGHAPAVRLLRLEEALRHLPAAGGIAVYYDMNGLLAGSASPQLDFERYPVQHATGIFHPKMVLLLCEQERADPDEVPERVLLVVCQSANLTQAGWWENVEAAHVERLDAQHRSAFVEPLKDVVRYLKRNTPNGSPHAALRAIEQFLKELSPYKHRSVDGALATHLYAGSEEAFPEYLHRIAGAQLKEPCQLEIISPYFENSARSIALERLLKRFPSVRECRVFLPRDADGGAPLQRKMYEHVANLDRVRWGTLPKDILSMGPGQDAGYRRVHAKVYRFFRARPKFQLLVVGSVNLTLAAHQRGGNFEAAVVVHEVPPQRPDFWLTVDDQPPSRFAVKPEGEGESANAGVPLVVSFQWASRTAKAWWNGDGRSPQLHLSANGQRIASLEPLDCQSWCVLSEPVGQAIAAVLERGNAFLEVEGAEREPATILVQEEGMHAKPSVGQRLSVLDILRYWSLSSAEEKLALLETQLQLHGAMMTIGESVMGSTLTSDGSSMFDRFAGIFHAFDCMERVAREYLDNDTPREAAYRVFGSKADSLGRVLDQIAGSPEDTKDLLPNYVIVLCAQQVIDGLEREYPEFWAQHRQEAKRLRQRLHIKARLRERLLKTYDDIDSGFLAWFERQFLAREGMRGAS